MVGEDSGQGHLLEEWEWEWEEDWEEWEEEEEGEGGGLMCMCWQRRTWSTTGSCRCSRR